VAGRGRLCVGIDPHPGLLAAWDLADDAVDGARADGVLGRHDVAQLERERAFEELDRG